MLFESDNIQELIYDYYVGHWWGQEVLVEVITQENSAWMPGFALDIIRGSSFSDRSQIRSILLAKLSSAVLLTFSFLSWFFISFLCLHHVSNRMTSKLH